MPFARRFGRVTAHAAVIAAAMLLPWTLAGSTEESESSEERRRRQGGLVGVIGPWTAVTDDGPALQIDGTKWRAVEPNDARAAAKATFGTVNEAFVANATSAGAFPIAVSRATSNFTAGTVRVKFKLVAGESDQTAGIVLGLQPNGEYLFLRYNTRDGNLAVWRFANGERQRVADGVTKTQLPLGAWHELVVTVAGTKITGTLSAAQTLSVEHTLDQPLTGRVGLWTKRDSVTRFRDFAVSK